jgi:hypothetical protein
VDGPSRGQWHAPYMNKIILVITKIRIALVKHLQQLKNTDLSTWSTQHLFPCRYGWPDTRTTHSHTQLNLWFTTKTMFTFTYIWSRGTDTYPSCMFLSFAFQQNVMELFNYNTEGRWPACRGKSWQCVSSQTVCCKWTLPQSEHHPSVCNADGSCW